LFFILVDKPVGASLAPDELPHHDIELIARRLYAIPSRVSVGPEEGGDFRGDLQPGEHRGLAAAVGDESPQRYLGDQYARWCRRSAHQKR
jgi:hypothetical protein